MKSGMLTAKLAEFIADGNLFEGDVSALPADMNRTGFAGDPNS